MLAIGPLLFMSILCIDSLYFLMSIFCAFTLPNTVGVRGEPPPTASERTGLRA